MSEIGDWIKEYYYDVPAGYSGSHAVVVIGKPACSACEATKRELGKHGIDYQYIDATQREGLYEAVVADNFAAFPVVWVKPGIEGARESAWAGGNRKDCIDLLVRDYVADQGDVWGVGE